MSKNSESSESNGSSNGRSPLSRSGASRIKYKIKLPFIPPDSSSDIESRSSPMVHLQQEYGTISTQHDNSPPPTMLRLVLRILAEPDADDISNEQEWYKSAYGQEIVVVGTFGVPDGWILHLRTWSSGSREYPPIYLRQWIRGYVELHTTSSTVQVFSLSLDIFNFYLWTQFW